MESNMRMWGLIAFLYMLAQRSRRNIGGMARETEAEIDDMGDKTYRSDVYKVSFKYPATWVQNTNYKQRYEGEDGYFELTEIETFGKSLDEVVKQEIKGPFKPYGSNPTIESVTIDGEPAKLILPSDDQGACFDKESALIVKNKKPIQIGEDIYDYLVVWADENHMDEIISTFKFLM